MKRTGFEELFITLQKQCIDIDAGIKEEAAKKKLLSEDEKKINLETGKFLGYLTIQLQKAKAQAEAHDEHMILLNGIFNELQEMNKRD